MTTEPIFPYFGGKRRAASEVWDALGTVDRYIEPFFGSGAVLLGAPVRPKSELVNDIDHHVANLWRALQADPAEVWRVASAPCSEVELKARAAWLRQWKAPDFSDLSACDPYAAGVWLFVTCADIGRWDGQLRSVHSGNGIKATEFTRAWYDAVCERMARVQVLCGDWSRCVSVGRITLSQANTVGVFLDPPYGFGDVPYEDRTGTVAADVWQWALANGDNPRLRIVVAGYEDGRTLPHGWTAIKRTEHGGYCHKGKAEINGNRHRERLWCSPHCHQVKTIPLFGDL
jgi:DNA adenine methylase